MEFGSWDSTIHTRQKENETPECLLAADNPVNSLCLCVLRCMRKAGHSHSQRRVGDKALVHTKHKMMLKKLPKVEGYLKHASIAVCQTLGSLRMPEEPYRQRKKLFFSKWKKWHANTNVQPQPKHFHCFKDSRSLSRSRMTVSLNDQFFSLGHFMLCSFITMWTFMVLGVIVAVLVPQGWRVCIRLSVQS